MLLCTYQEFADHYVVQAKYVVYNVIKFKECAYFAQISIFAWPLITTETISCRLIITRQQKLSPEMASFVTIASAMMMFVSTLPWVPACF